MTKLDICCWSTGFASRQLEAAQHNQHSWENDQSNSASKYSYDLLWARLGVYQRRRQGRVSLLSFIKYSFFSVSFSFTLWKIHEKDRPCSQKRIRFPERELAWYKLYFCKIISRGRKRQECRICFLSLPHGHGTVGVESFHPWGNLQLFYERLYLPRFILLFYIIWNRVLIESRCCKKFLGITVISRSGYCRRT